MVLTSILPSLLNLAQVVTILNTTVVATPEESTTLRGYLGVIKDSNSYGRRESIVGECFLLY